MTPTAGLPKGSVTCPHCGHPAAQPHEWQICVGNLRIRLGELQSWIANIDSRTVGSMRFGGGRL